MRDTEVVVKHRSCVHMKSISVLILESRDLQGVSGTVGLQKSHFITRRPAVQDFRSFPYCGHFFFFFLPLKQ